MPRPSPVRDAVRRIVTDSGRHGWAIEELTAELRREGVAADFSSVFRALAHLEQAGTVTRLGVGDGKTRFEAVQEHHDHIRCVSCERIDPIPGCVVETVQAELNHRTGYDLVGHDLVFSGLCPRCGGTR